MKLRVGVCMAVLAISCRLPADEPGSLVVRRLNVLPTIGERIQETGIEDWKNFFAEWGVGWPEGATLRYFPTFGRLVVKNTPQNIELLRGVLATCGIIPSQIEIQMDFVEFKMEDIDKLGREEALSARALLELWRAGGARLLFSPRLVTESGSEATIKAVNECIYPTEYGPEGMDSTNVPPKATALAGGNVSSNEVILPRTDIVAGKTPPGTNAPMPTLPGGPGAFEMREVGVILVCQPEMSYDGNRVKVALSPEIVYPPTWKEYGLKHITTDGKTEEWFLIEQPFFHSCSINTSVEIADGATVLIGGGMNNEAGDRTVFAFLTVRLIDVEGNPIGALDSTASGQD